MAPPLTSLGHGSAVSRGDVGPALRRRSPLKGAHERIVSGKKPALAGFVMSARGL